jgi:hypothetical protein
MGGNGSGARSLPSIPSKPSSFKVKAETTFLKAQDGMSIIRLARCLRFGLDGDTGSWRWASEKLKELQ